MTEAHRTEDPVTDRVWIWWEGREPRVGFTKPLPRHNAREYMRVLARDEVEKLLNSEEGCDSQQYLNSLERTIQGQRRQIAELQEKLKREREGDVKLQRSMCEAFNSGDGSYRP